jgi:putative transposase
MPVLSTKPLAGSYQVIAEKLLSLMVLRLVLLRWGTRDLHYYQVDQIKRVRVVRRADGYYTQFCVDQERTETHELTGKNLGIDVGLNHFLTDSEGQQIENPRFLKKDEKALKKSQRRVSRKKKVL